MNNDATRKDGRSLKVQVNTIAADRIAAGTIKNWSMLEAYRLAFQMSKDEAAKLMDDELGPFGESIPEFAKEP